MSSYIYTGKNTAVVVPKSKSGTKLIDAATFIINVSRPLKRRKSCGNVCFYKYKNSQLIDFQLDCIYKICKYPQIIYVTGIDTNKMVKHRRRPEFSVVENKIYELTNSGEDLRIGINAAIHDQVFWMDGRFVPTVKTYQAVLADPKRSTCLVHNEDSYNLGVVCNSNDVITGFMYSAKTKVRGLYYLNTKDTNRLKTKVSISFHNNLFDFDLLKEFNMITTMDKSSSYYLEEA
jgi:hypothetical protein